MHSDHTTGPHSIALRARPRTSIHSPRRPLCADTKMVNPETVAKITRTKSSGAPADAPKKVALLTAGGLAPCLSASVGMLITEYAAKYPTTEIICYVNGYMGLLQGLSLIHI